MPQAEIAASNVSVSELPRQHGCRPSEANLARTDSWLYTSPLNRSVRFPQAESIGCAPAELSSRMDNRVCPNQAKPPSRSH